MIIISYLSQILQESQNNKYVSDKNEGEEKQAKEWAVFIGYLYLFQV